MGHDITLDNFHTRDWEEPTDEEPVRVAMIGLGWWTRKYAIPAVADATACETTVLVSSSTEKAESVAADVETAATGLTYQQFHDGEATERYDAVYIGTPNALHREYTESAADFGKAVLCEKPMAADVADAEAMVEACEDAGVPLMVAYRLHTEPIARRARELIQHGAIGDVVSILGNMSDTMLEFTSEDSWRLNPDLSGGTTVNDIGIYPLNTIRFVLDADPQAVYARTEAEHDAYEGRDEHTAFQLEFPGHTLASCTASHSARTASSLRFVGTDGELTLEGLFFPQSEKVLRLSTDDADHEVRPEPVDQMREEFDYFANCLQRNVPPEPDGRHGLVDMRAIDALYESAETGERVVL